MSYINKNQEESLVTLFQYLCRDHEKRPFPPDTTETIAELRRIIISLYNKRQKNNRKVAAFIVAKRKENPCYARPKKKGGEKRAW